MNTNFIRFLQNQYQNEWNILTQNFIHLIVSFFVCVSFGDLSTQNQTIIQFFSLSLFRVYFFSLSLIYFHWFGFAKSTKWSRWPKLELELVISYMGSVFVRTSFQTMNIFLINLDLHFYFHKWKTNFEISFINLIRSILI